VSKFSSATDSRGVSLVKGEQATEPFASADRAGGRGRIAGGDGAQMTFAEGDNVPEALVLDRANESLGVGVEVRAFGLLDGGTSSSGMGSQPSEDGSPGEKAVTNPEGGAAPFDDGGTDGGGVDGGSATRDVGSCCTQQSTPGCSDPDLEVCVCEKTKVLPAGRARLRMRNGRR